MKKILFALVLMLVASCTNEDGARKALIDAGYKPIKVGGYGWLSGSENDIFKTKFEAYSPNDSTRIARGVVCEGIFKDKTIRLE